MSLADSIANWLRTHVEQSSTEGIVVGLSGGIDSAVVAALAVKALGPERALGVIMPAHSQTQDIQDAQLVASAIGMNTMTIDLSAPFNIMVDTLPPGNNMATANIKPRLRMITLYHIANTRNYLVSGTGNRSELMAGYFTKYGDGGVDLLPLGALYKRDVRALARQLGIPDAVIDKAPSAGLWAGQTDEEELGITYDELDATLLALDRNDTSGIPVERIEQVQRMQARSAHKRTTPPIFKVSQPISMLETA